MDWGNTDAFYGFWLIPVIIGFGWFAGKSTRHARAQLVAVGLQSRVLPMRSRGREILKLGLLIASVTCLVAAAGRPRYGNRLQSVESTGIDVMILLDVSRSMLAEDVVPNRLDRAKLDLLDLISRLDGDRVGLVVFSGAPVTVVPLTNDLAYFRSALERVDTESAPLGGSLIGDTIRKGLELLPEEEGRDRVMVLITDGDDQDSFPLEAADSAGTAGIPVITIGLGDLVEGARIPVPNVEGETGYLEFEGQEVWSRMNESLLREIALRSGGAFIPAATRAYDLGQVYDDHLQDLTRGALETRRRIVYRERFQGLVAAGFFLLVCSRFISVHSRPLARSSEGETSS